jgi:hypothetical protein
VKDDDEVGFARHAARRVEASGDIYGQRSWWANIPAVRLVIAQTRATTCTGSCVISSIAPPFIHMDP